MISRRALLGGTVAACVATLLPVPVATDTRGLIAVAHPAPAVLLSGEIEINGIPLLIDSGCREGYVYLLNPRYCKATTIHAA